MTLHKADPNTPVRPTIEFLCERLREQLGLATLASRQGKPTTEALENARHMAGLLIDRIDRLTGTARYQCLQPMCERTSGFFCSDHIGADNNIDGWSLIELVCLVSDTPGVSLPAARTAVGLIRNFNLWSLVDPREFARYVELALNGDRGAPSYVERG